MVRPEESVDDTTRAEVLALLVMGRKIDAIKLLRERTGLGLAEAKNLVEAVERGEPTPPRSVSPPHAPAAGDDADLAALLAQGRKIEAIKLYRERTGVGLAEAKAAVEALQPGQAPPSAPVPAAPAATVDDLIRADHKIAAIKLHREQTGLGLREAKDWVEARAEQLGRGAAPVVRPRETPIPAAAPQRPWWKFWG
jgi:ribosomal protein L7/L12